MWLYRRSSVAVPPKDSPSVVRPADGDGDCTARTDIGAYEVATKPNADCDKPAEGGLRSNRATASCRVR
jgi:hypothetical protein